MSTSTWSRLRWPFKALLIALPVITFGYFAINDGWFSATDEAVIDHTITTGAKNNEAEGREVKNKKRMHHRVKLRKAGFLPTSRRSL